MLINNKNTCFINKKLKAAVESGFSESKTVENPVETVENCPEFPRFADC